MSTIDLENVDLSTLRARLVTDKGTMTAEFWPDVAPAHVRNFLSLAQDGFYDQTAFHRIITNFMIQGGCPNTKPSADGVPGTGGPGHHVHAEFNDREHRRGVLSMARSQDPNSAGSQFFVVHAEHAPHLDKQYTAFGIVSEGLDVLDEIATSEVQFGSSRGERSSPVERIELKTVEVFAVEASDSDDAGKDAPPSEGAEGGDE
ncbi:MAG: peptidylprolyl isomerase [Planctomycetota bacterium]